MTSGAEHIAGSCEVDSVRLAACHEVPVKVGDINNRLAINKAQPGSALVGELAGDLKDTLRYMGCQADLLEVPSSAVAQLIANCIATDCPMKEQC